MQQINYFVKNSHKLIDCHFYNKKIWGHRFLYRVPNFSSKFFFHEKLKIEYLLEKLYTLDTYLFLCRLCSSPDKKSLCSFKRVLNSEH